MHLIHSKWLSLTMSACKKIVIDDMYATYAQRSNCLQCKADTDSNLSKCQQYAAYTDSEWLAINMVLNVHRNHKAY